MYNLYALLKKNEPLLKQIQENNAIAKTMEKLLCKHLIKIKQKVCDWTFSSSFSTNKHVLALEMDRLVTPEVLFFLSPLLREGMQLGLLEEIPSGIWYLE